MASDTAVRTDALLAMLDLSDEALGLAETCLRRLANRHGHVRTTSLAPDFCPDPEAHKRDVEAMSDALRAAGLAPYESGGIQTDWGMKPRHGADISEGGAA